jgi:site-specific recombinase XerD
MRGMAKDPRTVSLVGEFMNVYLPSVRRLDDDTVASYRTSISLYLDYLRDSRGISLATLTAADVCQESVVGFMSWLAETRGNVATTINHRLNDVRGLCHFLASRGGDRRGHARTDTRGLRGPRRPCDRVHLAHRRRGQSGASQRVA